MKFKKILLLNYTVKELEETYWERIKGLREKQITVAAGSPQLDEELQETDCLLVKLGAKVDRNMIDKAPKLKYIGMLGTGYGGIDAAYAATKNIAVCNIADYATEGVAEFTFGVILDYLRELERAKRQAGEGNYSEASFTGTELKGKNFGVIGLGHIGGRVAEIAQGFGAKVAYWSQHQKSEYEKRGMHYLPIEKLLQESDFISLNLSRNQETENFLDERRIRMIKKGAMLVNTSPTELVDLKALVSRLKKGDLVFILDHSDEMTGDQLAMIKSLTNCVIYPPIAYTTKQATALKQNIFVNNLENFLKGKPANKVN